MKLPQQSDPVPTHEGDSRERLIQRLTVERDEAREAAERIARTWCVTERAARTAKKMMPWKEGNQ